MNKRFKAITLALLKFLWGFCVVLLAAMVVVVTLQVISRQILQRPFSWTDETSTFLLVWLSFAAATVLFAERGHIAVGLFVKKFPLGVQKACGIFSEVLIAFFAVTMLIIGGWRASMNAWGQAVSSLPVTVGMMYLVMPICGVLVLYFAIVHMVAISTGEIEPVNAEDEIADDIAEPPLAAAPAAVSASDPAVEGEVR